VTWQSHRSACRC